MVLVPSLPVGFLRTVTVQRYFFFFTLAVMTATPADLPFTTPLDDTAATFLLLDDHFTLAFVPFIFKR